MMRKGEGEIEGRREKKKKIEKKRLKIVLYS
jgi:hypothetical protein